MSAHLFTYGSLVVPVVMEAVTGQRHHNAAARVIGFDCFLLEGRVYPGIVRAGQGTTSGRIYYDIDDAALERLDFFEADEYVRESVEVEIEVANDGDATQRRSAFTYVIPESGRPLLSEQRWDEATFIERDLETFLAQTRVWMSDYDEARA